MSGRTAGDPLRAAESMRDARAAQQVAWRAVVTVMRRARDAERRRNQNRGPLARTLTTVVCAFAGLMIIISAMHAEGTDLRPARTTDLVSLVQSQSRHNTELSHRVTGLRQEVDGLAARADQESDLVPELSRQSRRVGLTPVSGPAVTVTLDDAPSSLAANGIDPDLLVVHQQDIQAVVNALWIGGAEAMMIQNQRVISTTAVKCVGNTVVLHGIPYSPPYKITAIGDQERLRAALAESEPIQIYQQYVESYGLVFREKSDPKVTLPGHEGSLDLVHAERYTGFSEPTDSGTAGGE